MLREAEKTFSGGLFGLLWRGANLLAPILGSSPPSFHSPLIRNKNKIKIFLIFLSRRWSVGLFFALIGLFSPFWSSVRDFSC